MLSEVSSRQNLHQGGYGPLPEMDVGYLHNEYAESFKEFGEVRRLPHSGGWILIRQIPGASQYRDGMGLYPFMCCRDWEALSADLAALRDELVSLTVVTDPFAPCDENLLRSCFQIVRPFKSHFVTDLEIPLDTFLSRHHCRHARNALRRMRVDRLDGQQASVDEWLDLYSHLVGRHEIQGIRQFSDAAFACQLRVPNTVVFRASVGDEVVGMDIWYVDQGNAYNHMVAMNTLGYELHASYALQMAALEYFQNRARFANFGGVAGLTGDNQGGLYRFKRGWTNTTRMSYFCGLIMNPAAYTELCGCGTPLSNGYFPAYRTGEFD